VLPEAGVVGASLLSRGRSTDPSSPLLFFPLIPQRMLGNGKGWLEPGSGKCLSRSEQHCCLERKGNGGSRSV